MPRNKSILPDSLVSPEWLALHLDRPLLRIVDIRGYVKTTDLGGGRQLAEYTGARDEYEAGHIPGSIYVDWTADIVDAHNPVKVQIAPPEEFANAMEERGVGNDTDVVIVDHTGGHFATRLWWALRYYGHDRTAVLDGGHNRWLAEGRPVTSEVSAPRKGQFIPRLRPELRVEASDVLAVRDRSRLLVIDARDPGQYRGDVVRGSRGGHIPGAINLPAKALVNEDGTWKSTAELRRVVAGVGVRPDHRVVAYCNGGVTATAVLFALHRLGHTEWANYDGSWNEWGERSDLPVAIGPDPG